MNIAESLFLLRHRDRILWTTVHWPAVVEVAERDAEVSRIARVWNDGMSRVGDLRPIIADLNRLIGEKKVVCTAEWA